MKPILGRFEFDVFGATAYLYCLGVLFLVWLFTRTLIHSPFGRSLNGIRENLARMHAIGSPVTRRWLTIYALAAAIAGLAGALLAQTTQFVGLTVMTFERSGEVMIMLVFGGIGRLYGAFVGAAVYMLAQDYLARADPVFWSFWIGLLLVLVTMFARGGILGLVDRVMRAFRKRPAP
jgi:branched-chain amino acid transport system permease protein